MVTKDRGLCSTTTVLYGKGAGNRCEDRSDVFHNLEYFVPIDFHNMLFLFSGDSYNKERHGMCRLRSYSLKIIT